MFKPFRELLRIAIIGTIGVIMVGLFNFPPFQRLFDSTSTPTSTPLTTETVNEFPTDSSQLPTSTWTPSPSSVPSPRDVILFEEAFVDNQNGWYIASANPNITGGKYTHKVTCPADYVSYYCATYLMVPFSFPKNFKLEIDTTILESSVNADVGIGFQLRRNSLDH
jgi:hypothetical protein